MRRPRGFTLIEIIIATTLMATMGALTFGSFKRAWDQKASIENEDERYGQARAALDRMTKEISAAFISEHYDRNRYRERPTFFKGEDRGRRDILSFTAVANERFESDAKEGDQAALRYWVDRDPDDNRMESLFRRVNPIIDEDADRRGRKAVLCENVKAFDVEYWDAAREEWAREWDTTRVERQGVLPERVKLTLTIALDDKRERKFTTQTRIFLQRSLQF